MRGGGEEGAEVGIGALGVELPWTLDVEKLCLAVLAATLPLLPQLAVTRRT